ncbi:MAG: hypothetical protein ACJAYG_001002 [Oceanicoccus sp.]|jgi:hypothetical protein
MVEDTFNQNKKGMLAVPTTMLSQATKFAHYTCLGRRHHR